MRDDASRKLPAIGHRCRPFEAGRRIHVTNKRNHNGAPLPRLI